MSATSCARRRLIRSVRRSTRTLMDPLTASTTLATLVGLICNFKQERGANASASRDEFMAYLEHHKHEELKNLITLTYELSSEVDNLLREEHSVIIAKLNAVNSLLATLISRIDGLGGFAHVLAPQSELSTQAFGILCALFDSTSDAMNEVQMHGFLMLLLHNGGQIRADDQRFLKDDLDTLCSLGLLTREYSSKGTPFYRLTRNAAKFLAAARAKPNEPNA